jgi:hypothetical protein
MPISTTGVKRPSIILRALLTSMLLSSEVILLSQNLLTNPGFEDGTTGWSGPLTIVTPGYAGTNCALASLNGFGTVSQSLLGVITPGQTYDFSGYFRAASASGPLTLSLAQTDDAGSRSTVISNFLITASWQRFSGGFSFVATGAVTSVALFLQNSSGSAHSYYMDEFSLSNTSPSLRISLETNVLAVSWPTSSVGYSLQFTTNLPSKPVWEAVTNHLRTNSGSLVYTSAPTSESFFRLTHP